MTKEYLEGFKAYCHLERRVNPYPELSAEAREWDRGYNAAEIDDLSYYTLEQLGGC